MGIKERKERERIRYRNEIIDAAEELFFKKGINQTTMDNIASMAEISKTTLYSHFKSKDELIYAVHVRGEEMFFEITMSAFNSIKDTKAAIKGFLTAIISYHKQYPDYFEMSYYVTANNIKVDSKNVDLLKEEEHQDIVLNKWIELFERGKKEGIVRKDVKPINIGIIVWIQLSSFLIMSNIHAEEINRQFGITKDQLIEDYYELFFNGIFIS